MESDSKEPPAHAKKQKKKKTPKQNQNQNWPLLKDCLGLGWVMKDT